MSDAPVRGARPTRAVATSRRARGRWCAGWAAAFTLAAAPACAEPAVRILDLPFKVREMRGPRSEIATAVATSGLLPIVRAGEGRPDPAPIAVVWGDEGGAVLIVERGTVAVKPIGREAVQDLVASESPRGAVPGTRRALDGPLSAFLSGRTRGPDGTIAASTLTLRERQPLAVSTDPKPVPIATASVPAGDGAVYAAQAPRIVTLAGRPAVLAATWTATPAGASGGGLAVIARPAGEPAAWSVTARTPPGPRTMLAATGDFSGAGASEAATVDAQGLLRLWRLAPDKVEPGPEAAGYTLNDGDADLADAVKVEGGTDLALPVSGMPALAVVTARGGAAGTLRERLRVALPAPAGTGVAALGEGTGLRVVVGLGDGRVAAIALDGGQP